MAYPSYGGSEPWRMMGGITTGNEALDILVAAVLIFGVFSVSYTSRIGVDKTYLTGVLLTILTGFIGHELAHRSIARRSGLQARFVLWRQGIFLTLLGFVLRFALIVPGFVFMTGYASKSVNGKVAWSGPAINIVNGIILVVLGALTNVTIWGIHFDAVLHLAALLNFFLALFNLIPFGPLDGKKVREWNPKIWALSLGSSLLMWLVLTML
jgi:Zn-dependent protease